MILIYNIHTIFFLAESYYLFLKTWDSAVIYLCMYVCFFIGPPCEACGILVPQPGIEPMTPSMVEWNLNHWTAGEVPAYYYT